MENEIPTSKMSYVGCMKLFVYTLVITLIQITTHLVICINVVTNILSHFHLSNIIPLGVGISFSTSVY